MYQNPLIITDNLFLAGKFKEIAESKRFPSKFEYSISPFSDKEIFENQIGTVLCFDLRKKDHTDYILNHYDIIFSIHCKQIFPPELVDNIKCINVHPGYNPINRGWYPQVFAIINNTPVGATIHEIDNKLDNGAIIAREFVEQYAWDTSKDLYDRVLQKEIKLLDDFIVSIINNDYKTTQPEREGTLFLKKDFNQLCKINPDKQLSFGEAINILRALSHGDFENAYFIDEKSGKKVFLKLSLRPEYE